MPRTNRRLNYIHRVPEYWVSIILLLCIGYVMWWRWLLIICAIILVLLLVFFRGWVGSIPTKRSQVMCPCDGKVLHIVQHPEIGYTHVSIFLNIHNIHVQYMPCDGVIKSVMYKPGEFHPAYLFEKSELNERVETIIGTHIGDVKLVQIAGLVARRIVSFVQEGDTMSKGDPLGLIKFGSRVDIWLPTNRVKIVIKEGQRVRIGDDVAYIV